ncbi:MAG: hypothetical protein EA397_00490 [Deltaproteobacteria bacterium]|nr:MAG: hypothetical protein EA397_00490 [Deltaproteobacteria bacterium]
MLFLWFGLTAWASPDVPEQIPIVDVSDWADKLVVLDDGQGNLIAYHADHPRKKVFYGDRQRLYALQIYSSSAIDRDRIVAARDFRAKNQSMIFSFREGRYTVSCDEASRELRPLPATEAKKVVQRATFHEYRWRRNAVALFRDEYGVYYYIDRATGDDPDADHRVYVGWRGQILRSPLKLLASDSLGRVYSAANGTRRLVITGDIVRYVEGDTERLLHPLDLVRDGPFLYGRLGVYGDAPHGTPCDALGAER